MDNFDKKLYDPDEWGSILFTEEFVTRVQFCKQIFLLSIVMCCHIYTLGRKKKKTAKPEVSSSV